jgi:hypothetical protein
MLAAHDFTKCIMEVWSCTWHNNIKYYSSWIDKYFSE